jgi:two-component system, sensor histidine kinase
VQVASPSAAPQATEAIVEQDAPSLRKQAKRVMVIDDEETVREGMSRLLASWGYDCISFESAQEALDHLAFLNDEALPQVLISDYRLRHDFTGAQAIADLREAFIERGIRRKLPAIIVTGDTAPERIREAQATDALLLHKPVSAAALAKALTHALA